MAPCPRAPSLPIFWEKESAHDDRKDYSRWLHDAFDLRQRSDYAADYRATRDDADKTLENAELFVDEVKKVLSKEI